MSSQKSDIKVYNQPVIEETVDYEGFDKLMEEVVANSPLDKEYSVLKGVIRNIDNAKSLVCIDASLKSEGFVNKNEFFKIGEKESLEVGQSCDIYISKMDSKLGGIALSRANAIREVSWNKLVKAQETGETVEGIGFSRVKGGVSVDFDGVIAFLPGSQIDVRPVRDISAIVGKKVEYNVLSIEPKAKSIIVSRKAVLESQKSGERDYFLDTIQPGDIIEGTVKNVTNYGAFVDLGAVDGLLHVTDIMWEKISHPSEVLAVGQKVRVKVIKHDKESKRLSLGMKQLVDNPWLEVKERYQKDSVVKGKIVNITSYGAFVQLEPGIEGLLHVSEISWAKDSYKRHKEMVLGQEVNVAILDIDIDKHRISLSVRQTLENPWEKFAKQYNTGQVLDGVIKNVTDFGIFVGLPGVEVDGLIHVSDLSWKSITPTELEKYNKGDPIKVVYLGSDLDSQRIKLGVKQLQEDPISSNKIKVETGSVVTCLVSEVKPDGIIVDLFDQIKSFIPRAQLAREKIEQRSDKFVIGDRIDAKIIDYNKSSKKVSLSIRDYEEEEYKKTLKKYGSVDTGATIGSMLGEAIRTAALEDESDTENQDK